MVSEAATQGQVCPNCNKSNIGAAWVRSAFFHRDKLVVVEDIPALVCADCNEQFYDDHTVVMLDLLRGENFPREKARALINVPVFSLRDQAAEAKT
jgi:Ni2+-binding GTPase involved in maturation of urease and hydrogenase